MGGGGVKVPKPTAEERALQKNQAELLALQREIIEQQRSQQAILLPFLAEQEGFDVEVDANGNITSISKVPSELENKRKELEMAFTDRSLAALKGELPVSPALEQDLAKQERTLRDRLGAQFGPGYETSSPAIETLGDFFAKSEALREGARTDQLTLAEQLGMAREQQNQFSKASSYDTLRQNSLGDALTFAGAFGQSAAGFGQAQAPFIKQREMQLNASIANQQAKTAMWGAGVGAIGAIFSDARLKENAEIIAIHETGLPIYAYDIDGERRIGMFAHEVEEMFPGFIYERGGYKVVQYEDI